MYQADGFIIVERNWVSWVKLSKPEDTSPFPIPVRRLMLELAHYRRSNHNQYKPTANETGDFVN